MKASYFIAALLVGSISYGLGVLWSYLDAYFLSPPNWKFGRDGAFQLGVFASGWVGVCFAISFLVTLPLYIRFFRARGVRHLSIYSAVFVVALSLAWWSGAATRIYEFTATHLIPSFSGNGLPEIILSFFVTSLAFASLLCCAVFAAEWAFMRSNSTHT